MKHLHILLDNETHDKLKAMTSYHGEMSNIIRIVLQNFVNGSKTSPIVGTKEKIKETYEKNSSGG